LFLKYSECIAVAPESLTVANAYITKSLAKIRIAGGEQDASNVMFSQLVTKKTYQFLRPDVLNYGKLIKLAYIYHLMKGMGRV
jgi:hypothetical protein